MRVAAIPHLLALSAVASLAQAGPCGYGLTCVSPAVTYAPCSPEIRAEFELVAPLLQQCDDVTYYFNRGVWATADRKLHCDVNSPCGSLVPYIINTQAYDRICSPYEWFVYVLVTFRDYCHDEPVAKIEGDNGLMASLLTNNRTRKPTPAPTRSVGGTHEPIPNDETPTPTPTPTRRTGTSKPDTKSTDANSKTSMALRPTLSTVANAVVALAVLALGTALS